ncbi:MAG: EamA/RhaT family transporter [Flavipsychrobacter sp.]|nr:EamA/RhaT family transporter [Flavipsychrobacter sp.]
MVISMFLWGLSWPAGKMLTRYCSAANFTVYRYTVVVFVLLLLLSLMRVSLRIKKKGIPLIIVSGVLLACYSYVFFKGLKNGSPGAGGVLVTTMNPLIAYAINIVLKKKLPSGNEALGLIMGIIAGCVLLRIWDTSLSLFDGGNLYFLLAAFTWSVMSKFTAQGAKHGASMGFSLWQYLVTFLCVLPFTNFTEMGAAIHISDSLFWLNLFFSSAIATSIATTIYFYTTTQLGAERASSFIFLVPFAAALSSWLFLGEKIMIHTAIGGLLGIAAVYMINKKKKQPAIQEIQ